MLKNIDIIDKIFLNSMIILYPILGMLIGCFIDSQYSVFLQYFDVIFLKLLKLITPFLVFSMIVRSIVYLYDNSDKDDNFIFIILYYVFGTLFSILTAFILVYHVDLNVKGKFLTDASVISELGVNQSFISAVLDLVPTNLINILYHSNLMTLFVLACMIGMLLPNSKYKEGVLGVVDSIYGFSLEVVERILYLVPYALLSLFIKLGLKGFEDLLIFVKFLIVIFVLYIIRYIILLLEIYFIGGVSPWPFIIKSFRYQAVGFLSTSSKVTLPIVAEDMSKMGISRSSVQYGVSVGGMFNAIGFGLDMVVIIIFILNIYGIDLTLLNSVIVCVFAFLGIIAGSGIAAAPFMVLGVVLNFFHIPLEAMSMILVVDRIVDMCSTSLNVTGICGYTLVIDAYNKTLNEEKYYK